MVDFKSGRTDSRHFAGLSADRNLAVVDGIVYVDSAKDGAGSCGSFSGENDDDNADNVYVDVLASAVWIDYLLDFQQFVRDRATVRDQKG